jgi:hypothetical protein
VENNASVVEKYSTAVENPRNPPEVIEKLVEKPPDLLWITLWKRWKR